ncbi:hypothetical protein P3T23_009369 [Paraburkholderia sp. GAS448]|uniref:hypothetical protein n=1 Tax=Paraburkholderia sp. GAS448 TaxID=3035136 RepID=UPI003D24306D
MNQQVQMPQADVVILPDGYNGHTMNFYVDPIEVMGDTVKLRCAEPGKEYQFAWREKSVVEAAVASRSADGKLAEVRPTRGNQA